jgi:hypothetical protein
MTGSVRLDYQSAEGASPGEERAGALTEHYYVRAIDRLFVKNLLVFSGNFAYRAGNQSGQPVDFRTRYDLQMSSTGYGAGVTYEPYTIRRGTSFASESVRRWRANAYTQPIGWPRVTYDVLQTRQERESENRSREDWNSYAFNWQPGRQVFGSSYSRQVRSSSDSLGEALETYRALTSTDIPLPGQGRLALSYNYDRSWRQRQSHTGALDQHVPSASVSAQPARWIGWTGQYTGRYIVQRDNSSPSVRYYNDQLASGTLNLAPGRGWVFGVLRYFEETDPRAAQETRRTDYWQIRASTERPFFRQIRSQFTAYRIVYTGAVEGSRYSDAYFAAFRGRPHKHAELSTEVGLADRHGLQARRYAGNLNSHLRLFPTRGSQMRIGYSAIAEAGVLDDFNISEESIVANLQYYPETWISLSSGTTFRHNRVQGGGWRKTWSATGTYRWRSAGNLSIYYESRETQIVTTSTSNEKTPAQESWQLTSDWWIGPSTTLKVYYTLRSGGGTDSRDLWGVGLATLF